MEFFSIDVKEIKGRIDPLFYFSIYRENEQIIKRSKWPVKTLADISPKIVDGPFGSQLKVEEYVEEGVPLIRVKNVKDSQLNETGLTYITSEKQEQLKRSRVFPGDIVLTKAGSIGNAAILPSHIKEANITSHLAKIEPGQGINSKYLCEYLNTSYAKLQIIRLGSKTTRPELNVAEVSSILVIIPPDDVQSQVVELMQSAYQLKRQKEAEAQELLDSIDGYVLGELDIPTPQSEDKQCFVVWENEIENRRIDPKAYTPRPKAILEVIGKSKYPARALKELVVKHIAGNWGEDPASIEPSEKYILCNVIRNTNFDNNYNLDLENVAQRLIPVESYERIKLRAGDILLEKSGGSPAQPVGRVALATKEHEGYAFSNFVQLLRINTNECLPEYLFTYLRVIYKLGYMEYIQNQTTGIRNLIFEDFLSIPIPIPSDLTTQARIGNEVIHRMKKTIQLRREAKAEVEKAKAEVEKIILS